MKDINGNLCKQRATWPVLSFSLYQDKVISGFLIRVVNLVDLYFFCFEL